MSRYPSEAVARFDQQFAETPAERNERRRETVRQRTIGTLQALIADLSADLTDEGPRYSEEGLDRIRRRVANALPPGKCPEWLEPFRDPPVVASR
jgi:hypothetical protein